MKRLAPVLVLAKALSLRAAPGLVNLASLMTVAKSTTLATYGLFSTVVATGGMISNLVFGVITLSVVAQYANHASKDLERTYASTLLLLFAALSIPLIAVGLVATAWIDIASPSLGFVLMLSAHGLLQELLRARQQVLIYGLSDLVQSLGFFGAVLTLIDTQTGPGTIVLIFAASYLPALLISLIGLRDLRPGPASRAMAREVLDVGRWLVLSTFTENILYTGARYLVLGAAGAHALGVFSFAIDLSQRTVAFVVNAASFVYVPRAFAVRSRDGDLAFWRILREGGVVAAGTAVVASLFVIGVLNIPIAARYAPSAFDALIFVLVAAAGITNRLKKLLLEPVAIARGLANRLPIANAIGAAAGVLIMALVSPLGSLLVIVCGYLIGYLAIVSISAWLIFFPPSSHAPLITRY